MNVVNQIKQLFKQSWPAYRETLVDRVAPADVPKVRRLILRLLPLIYADYKERGDYPPYLPVRVSELDGVEAFAQVAITFARLWAVEKYTTAAHRDRKRAEWIAQFGPEAAAEYDSTSPGWEETRPAEVVYLLAMRYEVCACQSCEEDWTAKRWFTESDAAEDYYLTLCEHYNHVTLFGLSQEMVEDVWLTYDVKHAA